MLELPEPEEARELMMPPAAFSGSIAVNRNWIIGGSYTNTGTVARFGKGTYDECRISATNRAVEWLLFQYHNIADNDHCQSWGAEILAGCPAAYVLLGSN